MNAGGAHDYHRKTERFWGKYRRGACTLLRERGAVPETRGPGEGYFDKLKDSIAAKDLKAAFEAAHALKGVLGNLSLTPLYTSIVEITELLRNNTDMDYKSLLDTILEKKDELGRLCAD
ncbi:Hpt domain-containing protein [Fibrobacter sp. UWH4]|uniref:Hpt domain-containing protein n=1 Tax=Fibrobacter sp. UWH4 TaxID=1896210 RepID=UPI000923C607|nr:Hpt domain-containing protein [Fibrobacter sp. UWH4]SHK83420.1 Hpt domain-containing protein [Fibrobacter sp. UWH4]